VECMPLKFDLSAARVRYRMLGRSQYCSDRWWDAMTDDQRRRVCALFTVAYLG
jgi:hypothetical protein